MTPSLKSILTLLILFSLLLSGIGITPVQAATLTVTSSADSGAGSLRQAIADAASGDTILFSADMTITLTSGNLLIGKDLTIDGTGHSITINGNGARSFWIGSGTVVLESITITGGSGDAGSAVFNRGTISISNSSIVNNSTTGNGSGAVYNDGGSLTITDSVFSGNSTGVWGGAILNNGSMSVSDSTFSNNSSVETGGAIHNSENGSLAIYDCTFSGNTAHSGAALIVSHSTASISNSTFINNTASMQGGAIYMLGTDAVLTIRNSTFSGNSDNNLNNIGGAALYISSGTMSLYNSILANSTSDGNECHGIPSPNVNNLIEDGSCSAGLTGDPVLGTLGSYGGPTQTIPLLSGSPAIDAGDSTTCAASPVNGVDQRGVSRSLGSSCDIGAYESGASILTVSSSIPSANTRVDSLGSITVQFSEDAVHDGSSTAADYEGNYLLVRSSSSGFNTTSCAGGVQSGDTQIAISSAVYDPATFTATLTPASTLEDGSYRLFICGTTSIWSTAGLELNNGASDTTVDFTISGAQVVTPAAAELPATGFAPRSAGDGAAILPSQPAASLYSSTVMTLEIPNLGVNLPIVGVPQSGDSWDVTWLGDSAGWLAGTAFPTWQGNTVLTGHVWDAWNQPGPFAQLKSLQHGDRFSIHAYGSTYTYEVRENQRYWYDTAASTVFPHEDMDWVTLLTCENWNSYSDGYLYRRAVRAVLVSVE